MNWKRDSLQWSGLAMVAVLCWGASGAFGQTKHADSAAARLQRVEDRQAIEQLLMGDYPRALDGNDWAAYAAFFTRDGTLIMNGGSTKVTGPAAIQEFFSSRPVPGAAATAPSACPVPPGGHRSEHVVNNLTLQIHGDTATDQAYWQTIVTRDCKSVIAGAGHYEDVLKREDGQWKFFKRAIIDDIPPKTTARAAGTVPSR
ncbi:MAG: nuclear transport factor 2 family protein [Bryobacteraceae bacterium]